MTNKISFAVENIEMIDSNKDSNFAILSLDFFASGDNLHSMYVSENTLMQTANTIKNCPLIWAYDPELDDAHTHTKDESPCGFVPETSTISYRILPDGRTMLSVVAYVWRRYTGELLSFFKRDGGKKPVSVEMIVHKTRKLPNDKIELLDFRYEGITILGSYVTPAIPLAQATVLSFAQLKEEYMEDLENEFPPKYIDMGNSMLVTFPYTNLSEINQVLKGIEPPISLSQANMIAKQADAIGIDDKVNGWAVAISSFKKTHEVKDGRWVRNTESMSKGSENMNEAIVQETLGLSRPEKEEEVMEEKKVSEVEMAEVTPEVNQEEKTDDLGAPETLDVVETLAEVENVNAVDAETLAKVLSVGIVPLADASEDTKVLDIEATIAEMSAKIVEMSATIERMAEESKVYMAENEELKKFKAGVEESQKAFTIEQTIRELEEKVVIPEESKKEMLEESANYSYGDIENWKTLCKAKSFDFAVRENKESSVVVKKAGLPFGDVTAKNTNDLWR